MIFGEEKEYGGLKVEFLLLEKKNFETYMQAPTSKFQQWYQSYGFHMHEIDIYILKGVSKSNFFLIHEMYR